MTGFNRIILIPFCLTLLSSCQSATLPSLGSDLNVPSIATEQIPRGDACAAFANRVWAQTVYDEDPRGNERFDPDGDGLACEELPLGIAPALWTKGVPANVVPVELESVTDGDTIAVILDGRHEAVRLIGIDAEEAGGPYRDVECFGPQASDFLKDWLAPGDRLYLEQDREDRDRYGRLLRWVWLDRGDGEVYLLNEALVRAGYAERYRDTPNRRYLDEVREAEAFAQRHAFGLWGACEGPGRLAPRSTLVGRERKVWQWPSQSIHSRRQSLML